MMYKSISVLFLFLALTAFKTNAQEREDYRLIVGVAKFKAANVKQERFANMVSERVLDVLNQQNRFQVIDLDGTARKQAISVSQENYKSKNWIEANKTISAEYTLTGFVTSIKFIRLNAGKGYKATITYTTKIINTESGEIIQNGTATFSSSNSEIKLTPESAFQSAIQTTVAPLSAYFSSSFPIKLNLVRIEKEKKGKAQTVLLDGGSKIGSTEGKKFEVYFIDNSLGKPLPKFIGELKITRVLSEDFSEAKVTDGGKEIHKYLTDGKKIICKSLNND
ncbi:MULTISPECIES: hypothetical protein [unclassified Polaribacter]|uniref:hypothetical protein n=1 Tax=unclassified Polaribacter TaxID=196858 RepID=UPI0011BE388C|nr:MULTISPECIES: hypothetical protein [unclassified Polaribacter]TXD48146.1 hypothetical protein ES043_17970 [Polaribacter sp. IC063]TXD55582.1 hypothetical protein ES044_17910 [Polaribacter sp. IC066]